MNGSGGGNGRKEEQSGWRPSDWVVKREEEEPWPEAVNGAELLEEIARNIERFVVLGKWVIEAVSLFVLHSYAFHLRDAVAYLGIESPEHRCGKSTLLDVLGLLVRGPERAANISPSALFRVIAETQPTLLIDEADTFLKNDELKGILNSGYQRRGAYVVRVSSEVSNCGTAAGNGGNGKVNGEGDGEGPGGSSRLVRFSCWCPKAIARIGRLPQTLADRCIVFVMQRKLPGETCDRLKELDAKKLRQMCARFVQDHAEEISQAQPAVPAGLNDRAADIWEPLLALADLAGGDWPERARKAAVGLSGRAQEGDPMGTLLMDLLEFFMRSGQERVFTRTMADWLNLSEDRPWMTLRKGGKVTAQWLGQQLHAFGLRPKTMRIGDQRGKGYEYSQMQEVFRRYVPRGEVEELKEEVKEQKQRQEKEQQEAEAKRASEKDQSGQKGEEQKGEGGVKPDDASRPGT